MQLTTRNASLQDLASLLTEQQARKVDFVAPAAKIRMENGVLVAEGTEVIMDADGVTPTNGRYVPTSVFDEGVAEKLSIPVAYLRRMRDERPDLYDANVNGWLHGLDENPDNRSFLVRAFRANGDAGVARAFLSDSYKVIDNLDVLMAALTGIRETGTEVDVLSCDLTDRRMIVKVAAPAISALAPALLEGYRSPWGRGGQAPWETAQGRAHGWLTPDEQPLVFAGFIISNSETGGGAFTITPRLMVKICRNGLVITQDALRAVHLGGKLEEGIINWSAETQQKQIELVTAKARDAVRTFLDVDYMTKAIKNLEAQAGKEITNPAEAIQVVGKKLAFSQETIAGVLDHFIKGGQVTAGGVMQAVTSYAQTVTDADAAFELEGQAVRALELAAA